MNVFTTQKIELKKKIQQAPDSMGVYFYKSKQGRILYVGKSINIQKRVKSYFYSKNSYNERISELLRNIWDVDWIMTLSEVDALVLEDQMIKKYKPKYNVLLKDDKSYPYIKVTSNELFPKMILTRELQEEGAHYFGPYPSIKEARITIETLRKQFPLRTSKMNLDGSKIYKPCLNFQIGRCLAPCNGEVGVADYRKIVLQVIRILKGNTEELLKELQTQMQQKAITQEFEAAAILRNKIFAIQQTIKKQWVISQEKTHKDVIAIFRKGISAGIQVFFIRSGILLGSDFFFIEQADIYNDDELFRSCFSKIYLGKEMLVPSEIILSADFTDNSLEEYFLQKKQKIKLIHPQKGEKKQILKMALQNAEKNFTLHFNKNINTQKTLEKIKITLNLKTIPRKIECFDISNIQGQSVVASMVVMKENQFVKKEYRKFKIKVETADDIASMLEVLSRRWKKWQEGTSGLPNLTLIDGGKGQLNAAYKLAQEMGLPLHQMDLLSIAKGRSLKKKLAKKENREVVFDYLYKAGSKEPVMLKNQSEILRPFQKIRDEAHRVAINFHRRVRDKKTLSSPLIAISNIGEQKRKNLILIFKNIENIRNATIDELQKVSKISLKDAQNINNYFQKEKYI